MMRWIILFLLVFCQQKVGCSDSGHANHYFMSSDLVKITTINDDKSFSVNDTSKYTLSMNDDVFYYTFTDDCKCIKCVYDNKIIWEQGSNLIFPKSISVKSDLFIVFLQFEKIIQIYSYEKKEDGQDKFILLTETKIKEYSPSKIKFLIKNRSDPSIAELKHIDGINHGYQFEYIFDNSDCLEVKYDNKTVWKHGSDASEHKFPISVHLNIYTNMIFINMDDYYLIYDCSDEQCQHLARSTLSQFSENDLTFMTKGSEGQMTKIDTTNFYLLKYPDNITYIFSFKDDSNCTEIKYKNNQLWKAEEGKLPVKNIYINLYNKILLLETGDSIYGYIHTDQWKVIFTTAENIKTDFMPDDHITDVTPKEISEEKQEQQPIEDKTDQLTEEAEKPSDLKDSNISINYNESKNKFNTMTVILIIGGIILIILLFAVLVKFCIR